MMIHILSALALGAMVSSVFAEPVKLTPGQMDSIAGGKFATETQQGQGNLNNNNVQNNPGTVTETTSGPPGQIKQGNTECNNCTTTTTGPGNK
jgi:hypothetical protein